MISFKEAVLSCVMDKYAVFRGRAPRRSCRDETEGEDKYAVFRGRAPRAEYWWFVLFEILALVVVPFLYGLLHFLFIGSGVIAEAAVVALVLTGFALLLPHLAVTVRRLHDIDISGWWLVPFFLTGLFVMASEVISFVHFLLTIALLIATLVPGDKGHNRFGADPLVAVTDEGDEGDEGGGVW